MMKINPKLEPQKSEGHDLLSYDLFDDAVVTTQHRKEGQLVNEHKKIRSLILEYPRIYLGCSKR
jgi:hypothetical protein